jgi:hypothetical protein
MTEFQNSLPFTNKQVAETGEDIRKIIMNSEQAYSVKGKRKGGIYRGELLFPASIFLR